MESIVLNSYIYHHLYSIQSIEKLLAKYFEAL